MIAPNKPIDENVNEMMKMTTPMAIVAVYEQNKTRLLLVNYWQVKIQKIQKIFAFTFASLGEISGFFSCVIWAYLSTSKQILMNDIKAINIKINVITMIVYFLQINPDICRSMSSLLLLLLYVKWKKNNFVEIGEK